MSTVSKINKLTLAELISAKSFVLSTVKFTLKICISQLKMLSFLLA